MRTLQRPAPKAIELADLQAHIRTLITLEEAAAPVLSCYVNLDRAEQRHVSFLDQSFWTLRRTLNPGEKESLESAIESITAFVDREHAPTTRGIAMFSRGGVRPFFLALQFAVPVNNRISIDSTPNIHQLVELKDAYHRYVVMISTAESVRILEVNLGAITRDLWTAHPELRDRVGKEWARDHYQAHRRDRGDRFFAEKIAVLDRLMSSGGHTHLILAGTPAVVARVRSSLPQHLSAKVIDTVPESKSGFGIDVVEATLSRFVEREQQESLMSMVQLVGQLRRGGLAVAGTAPTLEALERNQVDVLVIADTYRAPRGFQCKSCSKIDINEGRAGKCSRCDSTDLRLIEIREAIIKQAERTGAEVEFVEDADILMALGGVGCLLRYLAPEQSG